MQHCQDSLYYHGGDPVKKAVLEACQDHGLNTAEVLEVTLDCLRFVMRLRGEEVDDRDLEELKEYARGKVLVYCLKKSQPSDTEADTAPSETP